MKYSKPLQVILSGIRIGNLGAGQAAAEDKSVAADQAWVILHIFEGSIGHIAQDDNILAAHQTCLDLWLIL